MLKIPLLIFQLVNHGCGAILYRKHTVDCPMNFESHTSDGVGSTGRLSYCFHGTAHL